MALVVTVLGAATMTACGSSNNAASTPAANCKPAHQFSTLTKGTLSVATAPDRPFSDVTSSGQLEYVSGEAVTAIAQMECLRLDVVKTSGSGLLQSVISKRTDLGTGGWYITQPRGSQVGQTLPILFETPAIVSEQGFSSWADVKAAGVTVGAVQGTLWVEDLKKYLPSDKVKLYQDGPSMFSDLATGRIGAVPAGYAEAVGQLSALRGNNSKLKIEAVTPDPAVPSSLTQFGIGFPHTLGNSALTKALDADIVTLRQSGKIAQWLKSDGIVADGNRIPKAGTMDSLYKILGADCSSADWADLCHAYTEAG